MKKLAFVLLALPVFLNSCFKQDVKQCSYTPPTAVATASEITNLQTYLTANNITATQHSSGIFYVIEPQGTGAMPTVCSNITVRYTGSIMGGNVFETQNSQAGIKFVLGGVILGWQIGLPMLKAGGSITLYIPPSLAYGPNARYDNNNQVVIPANSYLKFQIELVDVQ